MKSIFSVVLYKSEDNEVCYQQNIGPLPSCMLKTVTERRLVEDG